jgi:hypothetical protein
MIANKHLNQIIISPTLYREQLVNKLCSLLEKQPKRTYKLPQPVEVLRQGRDYDLPTIPEARSITAVSSKNLKITCSVDAGAGTKQTREITTNDSTVTIEELFSIYEVCGELYPEKFEDYTAIPQE